MSALLFLILLAVFTNGTLAGASLDTALVKLPARRRIGALAYATFARGNDLGNGLFVYPIWAGLATLLVFSSTILGFADSAPVHVLVALSASSGTSILHFITTSRAAPIMLSLGKTPDDENVLAAKLDRFARWHGARSILQVLAFLSVLWALVSLLGCASRLPDSMDMSPRMESEVRCGVPDNRSTHAVSVGSLRLHDTAAPLKSFTLEARIVTRSGLPDAWTFNGSVPGPELRVRQGDHVRVVLVNHLPFATSIHWHGIDVPNSADGVAGVTQDAVKPGQSFQYDFIAAEPGTYWYHSHQDTSNQVPRGLFGALIVEPLSSPTVDKEYTLVYHDAAPPNRRFLPIMAKILGSIDRRSVEVNGTSDLSLDAAPGQLVRLRIINATAGEVTAYGVPLHLVPVGAPFTVVALDGHDLHDPGEIESQVLPVGSGQRYDLELRMPASGVVRVLDQDLRESVTIGQGRTEPVDLRSLPVFDITRYGGPVVETPDGVSGFDSSYSLTLGNHAGFHDGQFGLVHTINGKDFPGTPMIMVRQGQRVRVRIVNGTEEYHPMHLHGQSFQVLARNGVLLQGSPVRLDTLLLAPHETWDVAFTADNPGIWMLHCHVLLHASTGMDMMVAYAGVSTPFRVGRASGNIPE